MAMVPPRRFRARRIVPPSPPVQIIGISVQDLFGKYSYDNIPISADSHESGRVSVLYGDNGTGKTTILRLLYATLSHERHRALRSHVAKTPFKVFSVSFSNGGSLVITKERPTGSFTVIFNMPNGALELFIEATPDNTVANSQSVLRLEAELERLNLDVLFVDHNRVVQSTYAFLSDSQNSVSDQQLLDDASLYSANFIRGVRAGATRLKETDLQFPLPQVVAALESTFRAQAFRQGTLGDQNAANVYLDIVKSITRDKRRSDVFRTPQVIDVVETLERLQSFAASFIRHGLISEYPFDSLISQYSTASKAKKQQIEPVLGPFLDSISRRLSALDEVHRRITIFETEISKYLPNKFVSFHILDGFKISDGKNPLTLDSLSSGERQLIFLLCSAAISRDKKSLILIDEPELSLNYKWQRMIAGSLANISSGGETQYILASHSIEIITRYVTSAYELPSA
jgi:energy-coupling factor transporter ATP-binding protein EcfA2